MRPDLEQSQCYKLLKPQQRRDWRPGQSGWHCKLKGTEGEGSVEGEGGDGALTLACDSAAVACLPAMFGIIVKTMVDVLGFQGLGFFMCIGDCPVT